MTESKTKPKQRAAKAALLFVFIKYTEKVQKVVDTYTESVYYKIRKREIEKHERSYKWKKQRKQAL